MHSPELNVFVCRFKFPAVSYLLLRFENGAYSTGVHMLDLFWLNNKVSLVAEIALQFDSLQEIRVQQQGACLCCIKVETVL